jgi:hypothetical protein
LSLESIEGLHHQMVNRAQTPLQKLNKILLIISKRDFWILALWIFAILNLDFLIVPYLFGLSLLWLVFSLQTWWRID